MQRLPSGIREPRTTMRSAPLPGRFVVGVDTEVAARSAHPCDSSDIGLAHGSYSDRGLSTLNGTHTSAGRRERRSFLEPPIPDSPTGKYFLPVTIAPTALLASLIVSQNKRISTQDYRHGRNDNSRCKLHHPFYFWYGLLL